MKKIMQALENSFAAVAFAEAGEFETAREFLKEEHSIAGKVKVLKDEFELTIDNLTAMAITYAEAGEFEKAQEIMQEVETRLKKAKDDLSNNLINLHQKYA
jgi:cellobiose-specific phosphotransferase system component IIA